MHVEPRDGESFDQMLRRFKTSIDKSGILREYKRKRYFKTNSELEREKPRQLLDAERAAQTGPGSTAAALIRATWTIDRAPSS